MPRGFLRGSRELLAIHVSALAGALVPCARAQVAPPTLQATARIAGAIPSQSKDSGVIPASAGNQATANDSFSGPVQLGTLAVGSANVTVNSSAGAGLLRLSAQSSDAATVAAVAILTNTEARAFDSIQITHLPGGQGQLSAMYFPTTLANGGMITGGGGTWSGAVQLTFNVQDFASDGTLRAGYTLAANYTNGNLGPVFNDTGPVMVPVQLNDTLTLDVDETLQTSANAPRGAASSVSAAVATHLFLVPLSPGLAFTSASGHSYLPLAGDVDVNGTVNFGDLLTLAQHYGSADAAWPQGDFNADGIVDFGDLLALAQNYGRRLDAPQMAAVPEPSIAAPAALAAAGLLGQRRRVQSAQPSRQILPDNPAT